MIVLVSDDLVTPGAPNDLEEPVDPQAARRASVLSVTGLAVSILIAVLTVMPAAHAQ